MKLNPNLPEYLHGRTVKNIVEMTDTESFMLWCKYEDDLVYSTDSSGCRIHIGHIDDNKEMPVWISVQFAQYKGTSLLRWEATSRFVDYTVVIEWFDLHFTDAYHTNTMNIHNIK